MDPELLRRIVEASVATAESPISAETIAAGLADQEVAVDAVEAALVRLAADYRERDAGLQLDRAARGWRLVSRPELEPWLEAISGQQALRKLSSAALEALAVIAYRQPVTVPEISWIRGVNSGGVVKTLLERGLVKVAGRKKVVGKPFLYRTSQDFLVHFGLDSVDDLPIPEALQLQEAPDEAN